MSQVQALWIPFEVKDLAPARRFYLDRLGLSEVDSWSTPGEQGSVLRVAPGAFIELVASARPRPRGRLLAFEMRTIADVDSRLPGDKRSITRAPARYPRGHYGFEMAGPAGADLMVWTEDTDVGGDE